VEVILDKLDICDKDLGDTDAWGREFWGWEDKREEASSMIFCWREGRTSSFCRWWWRSSTIFLYRFFSFIKKNVVFAMGFAENAIDAKSYKPMDIIKSMKGLTVEIGNTDAEGRLVLADTFTYVQKEYKPKKLVNLATLTGAIMVALGNETAGLFSNDENFA
jgi:hypothetical protein